MKQEMMSKKWVALLLIFVLATTLMPYRAEAASKPAAPKAAIFYSYNSITFQWNKVKGAKGYQLVRKDSKKGKYKTIKPNIKKKDKYQRYEKNLSYGKTHYYKVRAYTKAKGKKVYGPWSKTYGATAKLPNPKASYASNQYGVVLAWKKVTGAQRYIVYKMKGASWKAVRTVNSGSPLQYSDKDVLAGQTYKYHIAAQRKVKKSWKSSASQIYTIKVGDAQSAAPKTPTAAIYYGYNSLTFQWNPVSGATGYQVMRSSSKYGTYKEVSVNVQKNGVFMRYDNNLKYGTTYYYKVRSYLVRNGFRVCSNWSPIYSATVKLPNPKATTSVSPGYVTLKWNAVAGAQKYIVYRMKGNQWQALATIQSGAPLTYTDGTVVKGSTYKYHVAVHRQIDGVWKSSASQIYTVTAK